MNKPIELVAELRVLVGYLGEQGAKWWTSQFFSPNAAAFLSPVFTRTMLLAQYHGVTAAAARMHDEHIGIGRTLHLFRLPEVIEQSAASAVVAPGFEDRMRQVLASSELAMARLGELATRAEASVGPVVVGDMSDDLMPPLKTIAGLYLDALQKGFHTYPYLREV